jgi:thioredoxin reductase (NADPH)
MHSACEEASWLSKFGSKVYLIHRRDELRASKIMAQRVLSNPKIEMVWNSAVEEIYGEKLVTGLKIKNVSTGDITDLPVSGLFWAIGTHTHRHTRTHRARC